MTAAPASDAETIQAETLTVETNEEPASSPPFEAPVIPINQAATHATESVKIKIAPAPVAYNTRDVLYMLSKLVIGNQVFPEANAKGKFDKDKSFIGALSTLCFGRQSSKPTHQQYYRKELLDLFKKNMSAESSSDVSLSDVFQLALINQKKKDAEFNAMPIGVYISGSDVHRHLYNAGHYGFILDDKQPKKVEINDTSKTGKEKTAITQARLYADAVLEDILEYKISICVIEEQASSFSNNAPQPN